MGSLRESGLTEGASVALDLEGVFEVVPATVVAFLGPVALLLPHLALSRSHVNRLAAGVSGLLVVANKGRLHALGGDVTVTGDHLAMRLTDDFRLGQRRRWSRAGIKLDARLVPLEGEQEPTETQTTDVSPGGVQVLWPEDKPIRPKYEVTLTATGIGPPILAEAIPSRIAGGRLGLRFTAIDVADRRRLVELVLIVLNHRVASMRRMEEVTEDEEQLAPTPPEPQMEASIKTLEECVAESKAQQERIDRALEEYSDPWDRAAAPSRR